MTALDAKDGCCSEHSATRLEMKHINAEMDTIKNDQRQLATAIGEVRTVAVDASASASSAHHRLNKLDEYYQQAVETNIQLKHFTEAVKNSMSSHKETLDAHALALDGVNTWRHEHEKAAGNWWIKLMTHGAMSFVGALAAGVFAYLLMVGTK